MTSGPRSTRRQSTFSSAFSTSWACHRATTRSACVTCCGRPASPRCSTARRVDARLGTRQLLGITVTGGTIRAVALDRRSVTGRARGRRGHPRGPARAARDRAGPQLVRAAGHPARGTARARRHGGAGDSSAGRCRHSRRSCAVADWRWRTAWSATRARTGTRCAGRSPRTPRTPGASSPRTSCTDGLGREVRVTPSRVIA